MNSGLHRPPGWSCNISHLSQASQWKQETVTIEEVGNQQNSKSKFSYDWKFLGGIETFLEWGGWWERGMKNKQEGECCANTDVLLLQYCSLWKNKVTLIVWFYWNNSKDIWNLFDPVNLIIHIWYELNSASPRVVSSPWNGCQGISGNALLGLQNKRRPVSACYIIRWCQCTCWSHCDFVTGQPVNRDWSLKVRLKLY